MGQCDGIRFITMWEVILSKKAQEDLERLKNIGLFNKTKELVGIL